MKKKGNPYIVALQVDPQKKNFHNIQQYTTFLQQNYTP